MRKKLQTLREDIFFQKILIGIAVLSIIFPYLLFFTMPTLGLWQLISGCHLAFRLKDHNGKIYLLIALIWLLVMGLPFFTGIRLDIGIWVGVIYIFIPLIIAVGYLKYLMNTLTAMEEYAICQF